MPELVTGLTGLFVTAVFGYLLGSIPFGVLVTKALGLGDLRQIGSGNIGATNVLRTGSKGAALATLLLDGGKGAAAVLIVRQFAAEDACQLAGLAAFLGHLFPVWLGFKGGKGVATFLGILLALAWPVGVAACLTWFVAAVISRMSSLSALVASAFSPIWAALLGFPEIAFLTTTLAFMVFYKHLSNIERIWAGTEPKIGSK